MTLQSESMQSESVAIQEIKNVKLFTKLADSIDIPSTCKPIMFYLFSRHGIRYPEKDDIIDMEQILPKLQRLDTTLNKNNELCEQDYQRVKDCKLQMVPENDNHLTASGVETTKKIAGLFYERYSNLFDPSEVEFKVGITSKVRTNEIAHAFVDGLGDLRPGINAFAKIKYRFLAGSWVDSHHFVIFSRSKSDININEEDYVIRSHNDSK